MEQEVLINIWIFLDAITFFLEVIPYIKKCRLLGNTGNLSNIRKPKNYLITIFLNEPFFTVLFSNS